MRTVIAMTGASGSSVAVELLKRLPGEKFVVFSRWGKAVLFQETGLRPEDLTPFCNGVFSGDDMNAPFASGSTPFDHYVVVPCSVTTLGRIANGIGENLVCRVAEVALKENRRMTLVVRETPLSAVALENALKLARLNVTIMPMSPPFYLKPLTVQETTDKFVDHILTSMGLSSGVPGWNEQRLPNTAP